MKIVVLDDEKLIRESIVGFLSRGSGYEVWGAEFYRDAVALIKEHKPDICILDIMLDNDPDNKGGLDVLQFIKEHRYELKCIMITRAERKYRDQAGEMGAKEVLSKPVSLIELRDVVKKMEETIKQEKEIKQYWDNANKKN